MLDTRSRRGSLIVVTLIRLGALVALDVPADGGSPLPVAFRVFARGSNPTTQGTFVFDDAAAARVMAAYREHGVDVVIDLEHDSVNDAARVARNDAGDARGWARLELREGELWAVDVRWTPDGARRLREQTQRFISPVFQVDDDLAIREVFNLALVAQPATDNAPALAASRKIAASAAPENRMDPKLITEALDALETGDAAKALEILKALIASAAGGEAPKEEPKEEPTAEAPDAAPLAAALRAVLGVAGDAATIAEVKRLRSEVDAIRLERDAADLTERVALVGDLVKLNAEIPSTAWADADARVPSDELRAMPLAKLRARVEAFRASRGSGPALIQPAATGGDGLTDDERKRADAIKDPAARERFVATRLSRKAR